MATATTVLRTDVVVEAAKRQGLGKNCLLIQHELFSFIMNGHFGVAEVLKSVKSLVQLGAYCSALLCHRIQQDFRSNNRTPDVSLAMTFRAMGCIPWEDQQMLSDLSYRNLGLSTHYYHAALHGGLIPALAHRICINEDELQEAVDLFYGGNVGKRSDRRDRRAKGRVKGAKGRVERGSREKNALEKHQARVEAAEAKRKLKIAELEKCLEEGWKADEAFYLAVNKIRIEAALRKLKNCPTDYLDAAIAAAKENASTGVLDVIASIESGNEVHNDIAKGYSPLAFTRRLPPELGLNCKGCDVYIGDRTNPRGEIVYAQPKSRDDPTMGHVTVYCYACSSDTNLVKLSDTPVGIAYRKYLCDLRGLKVPVPQTVNENEASSAFQSTLSTAFEHFKKSD